MVAFLLYELKLLYIPQLLHPLKMCTMSEFSVTCTMYIKGPLIILFEFRLDFPSSFYLKTQTNLNETLFVH